MKLALLLTCGICFSFFSSTSQIGPEDLQQFIDNPMYTGKPGLREFYQLVNFQPAWIGKRNENNLAVLVGDLDRSSDKGLQKKDYAWDLVTGLRTGNLRITNKHDSLQAEVNVTIAALQFYGDIACGNLKPALGFSGLNYNPDCRNIPGMLAEGIIKRKLLLLNQQLSVEFPVIIAIENKIKWLRRITTDSNFKESFLGSNKVNAGNMALITKLFQLGIVANEYEKLPDSILKQKLKEAQRQFNLQADAVLGANTMQELNIPLQVRLQQLNISLNYYKWLYCLMQTQSVIVVNIPSAYLKVYKQGKMILGMRLIVGKPSSPTSTLMSKVDEVVLYPYWHVPRSIATKELLPAIKRNPGYLDAGNYQLLDQSGNIVDPHSVNWHRFSSKYFPYIIRQSTGCDNALGLLKLNFINPFGIYLHDTPGKNLFNSNRRFYSHGCMRMEKPMEMGHLILKNNAVAIDTLEQKGCLRNQAPVKVHADEHLPVIVWYNPVDIDTTGNLIFYEDVYKKFAWMKRN